MDNEIVAHLMDIKTSLSNVDTRLEGLETVIKGNGQPGLVQKVEELEKAKSWTWGLGAGITFLLGSIESWFHLGGHHK